MLVNILSDKFVTKENPTGQGIIDLDMPKGIEIFGGEEAARKFKQNCLINTQVKDDARAGAIQKLKNEGKLPVDYREEQ